MKVIVTGGAGFIGSHIVDLLVEHGHRVVVVDDLSNGSKANLNPGAKFYHLSINDRAIESVFTEEAPDAVCHQAAHTVVTQSVKDPVRDATINILGSLNLLANCLGHGCKKVVYASSCAIYGDPEHLPIDERHPIRPLSPYGVSKFTVEQYLHVYQAISGLEFAALRYANVYGPRQNPHGEAGVVALFSCRMLAGEQPAIFGRGDKTRAYVYVKDVARANLMALESRFQGVCNIGTRNEILDQEVFDSLSRELGYPGPARYCDTRPGEITRMSLDCARARTELGWAPEVGFLDGIAATARYYQSQFRDQVAARA